MPEQNYATHRHTPTLFLVGFVLFLVSAIAFAIGWIGWISITAALAIGLGAMLGTEFVLLGISRRYITKLQDRIIRLEMRMRCASILTPVQQQALAQLSMPQLTALRFACDAELPPLLERAAREQMTADQIKRAMKTWVPDWDRT